MTAKTRMGFMAQRDQSCSNCNAFLPNGQANPKSGEPRQGWCRSMPPALVQVMVPGINGPRPGTQGAWPTCNSDQWCRGWEPTEEGDNGRTAKSADA